jgi:predicted MFS family arabinose efflux permease
LEEIKQNQEQKQYNPTIILVFLFLSAIANGISMYKIIPVVGSLMTSWHVGEGSIGILVSSTTWLSVVAAVPLGYFVRKVAPKWSLLTMYGLMILGGAISILAPNFTVLIIGRLIDGIGMLTILVIAFSLVANIFPTNGRVKAISTITFGAIFGQIINLNVAALFDGWKGLFVFVLVVHVAIALLILIGFSSDVKIQGRTEAKKPTKEETRRVYSSSNLWLISIAEGCFMLGIVIIGTYVPTYLAMRGMELARANSLYSLAGIIGLFVVLLSGYLADKFKTKRSLAIIAFFGSIIPLFLLVKLPLNYIMVYVVLIGILPRPISPTTNASMPDVVDNQTDVPIGNSLKEVITKTCMIVGSIAIGYMIQYAGYETTIYAMMAVMAVGGLCWVFAKRVP